MALFPKKLSSVVWELTLKCNARCRHCGSSAGTARNNELTLDESIRICDQLIELKCERINLMGGELFLNPNWKNIASYLSKNGVSVSVIISGICALTFTPALCAIFLEEKEGTKKNKVLESGERFFNWFDETFQNITNKYMTSVVYFLKNIKKRIF